MNRRDVLAMPADTASGACLPWVALPSPSNRRLKDNLGACMLAPEDTWFFTWHDRAVLLWPQLQRAGPDLDASGRYL